MGEDSFLEFLTNMRTTNRVLLPFFFSFFLFFRTENERGDFPCPTYRIQRNHYHFLEAFLAGQAEQSVMMAPDPIIIRDSPLSWTAVILLLDWPALNLPTGHVISIDVNRSVF